MTYRLYFELDEEQICELNSFTTDLTDSALEGKLDQLIGREDELERMVRILCRRTKNNPVIIGEPGVGKTALVEGLAQKVITEQVPRQLLEASVVSVDLGSLVAGTRYRGEFEERLQLLIQHAQDVPGTILFIDEIHTLIGAGSAEGTMDAANMLKPALSRGQFRCIGATTIDEYRKYIEKDPALERRFQPIVLEPPNVDSTVRILSRIRRSFESFHGVVIANDALVEAVELSERYISNRFLPDKAIDVIDEACTFVAMKAVKSTPGLENYHKKLAQLSEDKNERIRMNDFYGAARIHEEENRIRKYTDNYQKFYFYSGTSEDVRSFLKSNPEVVEKVIPSMENPESLEEALHELEWFMDSETQNRAVSTPQSGNSTTLQDKSTSTSEVKKTVNDSINNENNTKKDNNNTVDPTSS